MLVLHGIYVLGGGGKTEQYVYAIRGCLYRSRIASWEYRRSTVVLRDDTGIRSVEYRLYRVAA
jgi:hypothetical protein